MYIHAHAALHLNQLAEAPMRFSPWGDYWQGQLPDDLLAAPEELSREQLRLYSRLDRSTQLAVRLLHRLSAQTDLLDQGMLILGCARGATGVLEQHHSDFSISRVIRPHTSPITTAGNIAAMAVQLNQLEWSSLTVSMTCSSALHAIIAGMEKIKAKSVHQVVAGGVESPITPFTRAQFEVLRLLSRYLSEDAYPCRPFSGDDSNRVVLAEGGALFLLSETPSPYLISGYGEAAQLLPSPVAMADKALRRSMQMAMERANSDQPIDLVIAHAPGTALGDPEELAAIRAVVGDHPRVVSGKWITGHTLGASGAIALSQALAAFQTGFPELPYACLDDQGTRELPRRIMINATGFGGNAATLIVNRC